jgi:SAM-dependent methyltransferase
VAETRFAFGRNWQRFAADLSEPRIAAGVGSLRQMLGVDSLAGRTFLDIGSGSGLFSLAAVRLGAARVHSFDYDAESVACTQATKARFAADAVQWTVAQGSVLDDDYVRGLGAFDIVYSWGVLHHTGDMWRAVDNASRAVAPGGTFFIAIYNDQGLPSRLWWHVKKAYCSQPWTRPVIVPGYAAYFAARGFVADAVVARKNPIARYVRPAGLRGMKFWPDLLDWLGGFPFQVATPDTIVAFCRARGFELRTLVTVGRALGNNEFVFAKDTAGAAG